MTPTVVIAAGGTGGHVFPAAAFAAEMVSRTWRVTLVTDERGRRYAEGFPASRVVIVEAGRIGLSRPVESAISSVRMCRATGVSLGHIREEGARLVAGFGGYASFPCLLAARLAGVPLMIHEQNTVLGRVNRFFAKSARVIASGFDRLDRLSESVRLRHIAVGNPVRADLARALEQSVYPPASRTFTILVVGGSQGAARLGKMVPEAIAALPEELRWSVSVVQQVRAEQIDSVKACYSEAGVDADLSVFFTDMAERLTSAHLVIARSGASTLAELALAGRPSILIPLPSAADDHQAVNARTLVEGGAADLFSEQGDHRVTDLSALIARRLGDSGDLVSRAGAARGFARPYAAQALADLAESFAVE